MFDCVDWNSQHEREETTTEAQQREVAGHEARNLNVAKELHGMTVLNAGSGEKLGEVTDALIHATQGRMIGIALRTPEGEMRDRHPRTLHRRRRGHGGQRGALRDAWAERGAHRRRPRT